MVPMNRTGLGSQHSIHASPGGTEMSSTSGGSVIVAGARTPVGRLLGGLKSLSAADLGGVAIKGALEKAGVAGDQVDYVIRSEEHTSELQSLMRISYAVFCLKKKKQITTDHI